MKTIFLFISDNGLNGTHQGLGGVDATFFNSSSGPAGWQGATLYEGGIRSPGIDALEGQGEARQHESKAITGFEDWIPTLLELLRCEGQNTRWHRWCQFCRYCCVARRKMDASSSPQFPNYGASGV